MKRGFRQRKGKKTFSLSADALAYLRVLAKKSGSASAALDQLIREKKLEAERQRISAGISNYYDSISETERGENEAWGAFSESQFPKE
jgi:hypothetical protein